MNFFSVPNGVCTSASQGRILKAEGMTAGVADTILLVPSRGVHALCIEFKQEQWEVDEKGKLSLKKSYQRKEQRDFQASVERLGYRYEVVRNVDEFEKLINDYMKDYGSETC